MFRNSYVAHVKNASIRDSSCVYFSLHVYPIITRDKISFLNLKYTCLYGHQSAGVRIMLINFT